MASNAVLEYPALNAPLVLIACRACEGRGETTHYSYSERPGPFGMDPRFGTPVECRTCDGTGQVLVDEVMASDEVLDADALTANEAFFEAYVPPPPTKTYAELVAGWKAQAVRA
jgi:hypothetical protein